MSPPLAPYSLEFGLVVLVPNQGQEERADEDEPRDHSQEPPRRQPATGPGIDRAARSWPRSPAPSQASPRPENGGDDRQLPLGVLDGGTSVFCVDQQLVDDDDEAAEAGARHEAARGRLRPAAVLQADPQLKKDRHRDREDDVGDLAYAEHPAAERAERGRGDGGQDNAKRPRPRCPEMRQLGMLGLWFGTVDPGLVGPLQDRRPGFSPSALPGSFPIRRFHGAEKYTPGPHRATCRSSRGGCQLLEWAGVPGFVQTDLACARDLEVRDPAPALVLYRRYELDALALEFGDGVLDVMAHEE